MPDIWQELIKITPAILWIVLAAIALFAFRGIIRTSLLPRMTKFKAFGVETNFVKDILEKEAAKNLPVGDTRSRMALVSRSERLAELVAGAAILLVNDVPQEMDTVISIFKSLKMTVTTATSSHTAIDLLKANQYDVVISDMTRDGGADEGARFLAQAVEKGLARPTIFTVANFQPEKGTPPYAFGITNRIDELVHLVFDVLERRHVYDLRGVHGPEVGKRIF
jgi:CheY-like chemotaxis protein